MRAVGRSLNVPRRRENLVATKKSRRAEKISSRRKNLGATKNLVTSVGAFNVNLYKISTKLNLLLTFKIWYKLRRYSSHKMLQRSCREIAEPPRFFRRDEIFSARRDFFVATRFFRRSVRILGGYMLPPFIFAPFLASSCGRLLSTPTAMWKSIGAFQIMLWKIDLWRLYVCYD